MNKEVTCIAKRGDHYNPHERIQGIGGRRAIGVRWWRSEDDAIRDIESGSESYYVSVNGKSVSVKVAEHSGRKYLKTIADGYKPDNLLALPDCRRDYRGAPVGRSRPLRLWLR